MTLFDCAQLAVLGCIAATCAMLALGMQREKARKHSARKGEVVGRAPCEHGWDPLDCDLCERSRR